MKTTGQAAAMATSATGNPVSRSTVDREIARGNLRAEKVGRYWMIEDDEAARWARFYRPYLRQRNSRPRVGEMPGDGV